MKKLLLPLLFVITACSHYTPPPSYEESLGKIMEDCNKELEAGGYSKRSEMLEHCQKPKTVAAYMLHRDERDADLFTALLDYEIKVARDLERNKISTAQATALLEKFTEKQIAVYQARAKNRQDEADRARRHAEKERQAEKKRLADYYKKNPHEYIKLVQEEEKLELLRQQNQILLQQEAQRKQDEENRRFSKSLENFADSLSRRAAYAPVNCNTSYGYSGSSTTCY